MMLLRRLPGRLGRHGYALVARGRRGSSPRAKGDVPAGWDCAPGWTRSIRRVAPEVCFIDSTGVLWIPFAGRRLRRLRRAVGRSWQSVLTPLWREGIEGIGRAVGMGVTSRERNLAVDGARACAAVRQLGIDCSDGQDPCWLDWAVVMGDVDEQWCFGGLTLASNKQSWSRNGWLFAGPARRWCWCWRCATAVDLDLASDGEAREVPASSRWPRHLETRGAQLNGVQWKGSRAGGVARREGWRRVWRRAGARAASGAAGAGAVLGAT